MKIQKIHLEESWLVEIIERNDQAFEGDILIVASKLKKYVKEKHGLNTSSNVMEALSSIVRIATDRAIDNAKREGRKTLMDRDF